MMAQKTKFYVVWKGRKKGIYNTWEACAAQVQGFTGAQYKGFDSRLAAEKAFQGNYSHHIGKPSTSGQWLFAPDPPIAESYCVDAACSGSPGRLEYQGVHTSTGKEIFHEGPFENGTNNVGEFLALVHILIWLKQHKISAPVYSDSETGISWVKKKSCNTELTPDKYNAPLFKLIDQAEEWLEENKIANPILKWDTKAWGEIPADFNRK